MKKANIPIFVPHWGCPHQCVFCNQQFISGGGTGTTEQDVRKTVERALETLEVPAEIAFFGGSFTGIAEKEQEMLLRTAASYIDGRTVTGLRLSTRPDYIDDAIIERLIRFGVTTVELGAQSTDEDVLRLAKRGHTAKDIWHASEKLKKSGLLLGLQMMTGLPGSTIEKDKKTGEDFCCMGPKEVRIYPTLVVKNTDLCCLYRKGQYTPQTLDEAVYLTAQLFDIFDKKNICVIRMGLQPSDILEESIVEGPYHPAFGELVQSQVIFQRFERYVEKTGTSHLTVFCGQRDVSRLFGQKRKTIQRIAALVDGRVTIMTKKDNGIVVNNQKIW